MDRKPWQQYQAIYVHFPFCKQKCLYCDFTSYAACSNEAIEEYISALCNEIKQTKDLKINPKATIYFGGGTPSLLTPGQVERVVAALKGKGLWQQPIEATIEANPGTVDLDKLRAFKKMGFNRISLGVQSLSALELKAVGRIHDGEQALEAIELAYKAGFTRINADVIYGLPKQSLESLRYTLKTLVSTSIDHISVYGLIVEPDTPLENLLEKGRLVVPDEDCCADMYDYVQDFLEEQGFFRYEISNYARGVDGKYSCSRHNDVYWHYWPYAAFGASAVSFNGESRFSRPLELKKYINWVNARAADLSLLEERLSPKELLSEFLIMGLRRAKGVNLEEAKERFGINILEEYQECIRSFEKQGLLVRDKQNKSMALTKKGMALGNFIFEAFV